MLIIDIESRELYNEETGEFVYTKSYKLQLEHSLISLQKWEAETGKRFLSKYTDKTDEEIMFYIKCMTINNVPDEVYGLLTEKDFIKINDYINKPMTATTFSDETRGYGGKSVENISAEIIYYWMFQFGINFECRKWHLNSLLSLIRVCNIKSQPGKKLNQNEIYERNRKLNEERRKRLNSKG